MNHNDFITLVKHPDKVLQADLQDLKELVDRYPSFVQARLLYTKALQVSQSIHFGANLKLASLYSSNKRWLYYYIHPDRKLSAEPYRRESAGISHGDYFDMMENLEREGGDTKQSLKNLAERLKSARALVTGTSENKPVEENGNNSKNKQVAPTESENQETLAKKMIKDKKYPEAIEILRKLNLNNPKKSVYFADQIRFLEKVIENSKK